MIAARTGLALLATLALSATPLLARAALGVPSETAWDGTEPPQGIYFNWYEPSFYTGFAPRTQDPLRPHLELSRGNQVRLTIPLTEKELDVYLDDLAERHKVYQELVDAKVITLTVNKEYERYVEALEKNDVAKVVESRASLGPEAYRAKSVEILSALNPGRVVHVKLPFDPLVAKWQTTLADADLSSDSDKIDAANALVPGRIDLYQLDDAVESALIQAAGLAKGSNAAAFRASAEAFVETASRGNYNVRGGNVEGLEFTAIYPAGTIEGTMTYKGERLPEFGVTGIWPLIRRTEGRGQVGMVDYISPNPGYGFISMLPYQHAGGITYNAYHNAGVRCQLNSTPFLPSQWRQVPGERDPRKPYQNLWIASRAPTSHGCTRIGSGNMSELRQALPTSSDDLEKVANWRNQPYCYDVFDVDADGRPEVMGIQYYLAFKSTNDHVPIATYVTNKREPFYKWLYGDNVNLGAVGQTTLKEVPVCRFVGLHSASEKETLTNLPLFEAKWTPETIQFYTIRGHAPDSAPGFEFNRELRKVGAGHVTDRSKLLLK